MTEATILSKDGSTLHNFGSVEATANKSVAYTTFNSTTALFFSYSSTNSTFAVEQKDAPITFRGLPTPSKVFRTDGRSKKKINLLTQNVLEDTDRAPHQCPLGKLAMLPPFYTDVRSILMVL